MRVFLEDRSAGPMHMRHRRAMAYGLLLSLSAAAAWSPAAAQNSFGTPAEQQGLIANICGTQLAPLGAAGCACLAERAMIELDQPQRDYLILSVVQPQAADRTDTARSPAELKVIATFIREAQTACNGAGTPATAPAEAPDAAQ